MAAVIAEKRDWPLLSSELLLCVAEQLLLADVARLPAVCRGWAWNLGLGTRGWPPTFRATFAPIDQPAPWLLLPNEDGVEAKLCDFLRPLGREAEGESGASRVRISPLPEMADRICVGGSPDGWIATVDIWLHPRILNPLTREEFPLPSLFTMPPYNRMTPIYTQEGDGSMCEITYNDAWHNISFGSFKYHYVRKIILSSAPPTGIALLLHCVEYRDSLAIARVGDLAWTPLDLSKIKIESVEDAVYDEKNHKFFVISLGGQVAIIDLKNYHWGSSQPPGFTLLVGAPGCKLLSGRRYIAFSSVGDLLQIWRQYKCFSENNISYLYEEDTNDDEFGQSLIVRDETIYIKVFKFDPRHCDGEAPASSWIHTEDLGDDALFLGLNYSTCMTTSNKPWLRRNSVYFAEDTLNFIYSGESHYTCDGGIYDLKLNKIERFFPTHSTVNWPPPAWFMPSHLQFIL